MSRQKCSFIVLKILRGKLPRRLLCVAFLICFVTCVMFWAGVSHHHHDCTDYSSRLYLEQLCANYSAGLITGSLCAPLCDTKEITFQECLGHGVKLYVLMSEWNGYKVILKSPGKVGLIERALVHVKQLFDDGGTAVFTKQEFIQQANLTIFFYLSGMKYVPSTIRTIEDIFTECDIKGDGVLHYDEAVTCWQLVHTEELMLFLLLRDMQAMLEMYGTCGALYAVQYASSEPFLGYKWEEQRDWDFRARLALSLLDLVESLEDTPYGTLYLCDVQEANFGVTKMADGNLVAKAIDTDLCWFEKDLLNILDAEKNNPCNTDEDCAMINCRVRCNRTTGTCSGALLSNNLQSVCRHIFWPQTFLHPALLKDPPKDTKQWLDATLSKCVDTQLQAPHIPLEMLSELRNVLTHSIHD